MKSKPYSEFFSPEELKCRCGTCDSVGTEMDCDFMMKIYHLRKVVDHPFVVTSAFRCPEYNDRVSHTGKDGAHTTGRAIDFIIPKSKLFRTIKYIYKLNLSITGIGISNNGAHEHMLHLDNLIKEDNERYAVRPNIWLY